MRKAKSDIGTPPWLSKIVDMVKPLSAEEIASAIMHVEQLDPAGPIDPRLLALNTIFQFSTDIRAKMRRVGIELRPSRDEKNGTGIQTAVFEALSPFGKQAILTALYGFAEDKRVEKLLQIASGINDLRCKLQATLEIKIELDAETIKALVESCMKLFNLSQLKVSRESDLAQGTIFNVLAGKPQTKKTRRKLSNWLETQKEELKERLSQASDTLEAREKSIIEKFLGLEETKNTSPDEV